jgi:Zn finger protein HypA/HybF involved in hydrogenase expression
MPYHPRLLSLIKQTPPSPAIQIALGELFPLTENQLRDQWNELVKDSPLASSKLYIRLIPAEQQCMVCFQKYHPQNKETACPHCKSMGAKILMGEEFYVETYKE